MNTRDRGFHQEFEFLGRVRSGDRLVEGLHFSIKAPTVGPGLVEGICSGTTQQIRDVDALDDDGGIAVESLGEADARQFLQARVQFRGGIVPPHNEAADSPNRYSRKMAVIDLNVETRHAQELVPDRIISYALVGGRGFWPYAGRFATEGDEQEQKVGPPAQTIPIGSRFSGVIGITRWPYSRQRDVEDDDPDETVTRYGPVLQFRAGPEEASLKDDELLNRVDGLIEDIMLLARFGSRGPVNWQRRRTFFGTVSSERWNSLHDVFSQRQRPVIPSWLSLANIERMLGSLERWRKEGIDLKLPITWTVLGHEADLVAQSFAAHFLALEKLKELWARAHKIEATVAKSSTWRQLAAAVRGILTAHIPEGELRDEAESKINELRRTTIQFVVDKMCDQLGVTYRDLYPPGAEVTLFRTRNHLFHTASREPDEDVLELEAVRVQALVERILMHMLEVKGAWRIPEPWWMKPLTTSIRGSDAAVDENPAAVEERTRGRLTRIDSAALPGSTMDSVVIDTNLISAYVRNQRGGERLPELHRLKDRCRFHLSDTAVYELTIGLADGAIAFPAWRAAAESLYDLIDYREPTLFMNYGPLAPPPLPTATVDRLTHGAAVWRLMTHAESVEALKKGNMLRTRDGAWHKIWCTEETARSAIEQLRESWARKMDEFAARGQDEATRIRQHVAAFVCGGCNQEWVEEHLDLYIRVVARFTSRRMSASATRYDPWSDKRRGDHLDVRLVSLTARGAKICTEDGPLRAIVHETGSAMQRLVVSVEELLATA